MSDHESPAKSPLTSLVGVTLPATSRKRDRPKTSVLLTAIRLPKKRRCIQGDRPKGFQQKTKEQRYRQIMCCFFNCEDANRGQKGEQLSETCVEQICLSIRRSRSLRVIDIQRLAIFFLRRWVESCPTLVSCGPKYSNMVM